MNEDTRTSRDPDIEKLTQRTVDDVAALAHQYAGVAKHELASAGEQALWPAAIGALGGLFVVVGVGMLVASPAVPSAQRRLKRRVRFVATSYVALGGIGAIVGLGALISAARHALPRTRHNVAETVDVLRDRL
jgi:hypothetical protein